MNSTMEETAPKRFLRSSGASTTILERSSAPGEYAAAPESDTALQSVSTEPAVQQLTPLELLIPETVESTVKMEMIFLSKSQLFSGRYDAASICAMLASLDESDLRCLRDQLHAALPEQVPAAAGRPLIKRKTGSSSRLVDDCWALGSSAAQGILTRFADSQTLRAAERVAQSELVSLAASSSSSDLSAVRASMEALIATQLRLEKEVATLRDHNRAQDRRLEELSNQLEEARSRLSELESPMSVTADSGNEKPGSSAADCPLLEPVCHEAAMQPAAMQNSTEASAVTPQSSVTAKPPLPPPASTDAAKRDVPTQQRRPADPALRPAVNDVTDRPAVQQNSLAQDIAASLDLRSLGMAIVSAMQIQESDSDSDGGDDMWPPLGRPARGDRNYRYATRRTGKKNGSTLRNPAVDSNFRSSDFETMSSKVQSDGTATCRPGARMNLPKPITGTGAPSGLVATTPATARDQSPHAIYVL